MNDLKNYSLASRICEIKYLFLYFRRPCEDTLGAIRVWFLWLGICLHCNWESKEDGRLQNVSKKTEVAVKSIYISQE